MTRSPKDISLRNAHFVLGKKSTDDIEGERSLVRHGPAESQQHLEIRKHHAGNVVSMGGKKTAAFSQRRNRDQPCVCNHVDDDTEPFAIIRQ